MKIERYQAYKNSEVAWLGDVPEHWETHTVKRVAKVGYKNFVDGDWIESPFITDKGIRLIQTGNVGIGIYKEKGWRYIAEKTFSDLNCTEIYPGDVLICRLDGPVGRACLVPDLQVRMITSVDNTILKPSKDFDPKFIVYVMSSSLWLEWIQTLCRVGGGFRFRISRSMLGELRIQKPPLSEQKAIAHYLDTQTAQIDRKIDLLTQKATLYGKLKQSLINEIVTRGLDKSVPMKNSGIEWIGEVPKHWRIARLKDIGTSIIGITYSPEDVTESRIGSLLVLRSSNIQNSQLCLRDTVYVNKEINPKQIVRKGDILICSRNGSRALIGKNICIDERTEGQTFGAFMTVYRTKYFRFISYFFNSQIFESQSGLFGSSTVNQLTINTLNNFLIALPPLCEQIEMVNYLNTKTPRIDKVIQTINTQIEKLKELRKTLINDVVTGKIKVV